MHWLVLALLAALGLGSGLIAFMLSNAQAATIPVAAIEAPTEDDKVSRILEVAINVTRRPDNGTSLWLGYQNEAGGPLIVQTQKCKILQKSADCGPLHVGRDEKDKSAFKIFLFAADEDATSSLEDIGGKIPGGPGANMAIDEWPDGTDLLSMVRNVTLRSAE
ncbi:hypothetical protein Ato02nite_097210 [Paractinoplanes toevensis]|uniref:Uncharacterized protein n=2 Tax=Paractinoplanes toevensis TaxID=571911 RepID=A0A919WD75_9ACTN|nr:hypothetical protein Ato02nite_097210 [Actinoplanes toevensis]